MSFFLTEEQEETINIILDEENKKICEEQLNSEDFPEELKEIIRKTVEAGAPIPAFDPQVGYYTISFTPCEQGNRIYLHHHLTNVSRAIDDPLQSVVNEPIVNEELVVQEPEAIPTKITEVIDPSAFGEVAPEYTPKQLEAMFGPPPQEVQNIINVTEENQ